MKRNLNDLVYANINRLNRFVSRNTKVLTKIAAWGLGLISIISFLIQFYSGGINGVKQIVINVIKDTPEFLSFYKEPRAIIIYLILIIVFLSKEYYKYESRFLKYTLEKKNEIAAHLIDLYNNHPTDHYIGLIIGKLGDKALEVKDLNGQDLLNKIDINIKKNERVYWISHDELGILFYEIENKPPSFFMNTILRDKLEKELGNDGVKFHTDIKFSWIELKKKEELFVAEQKVKKEWDKQYLTVTETE